MKPLIMGEILEGDFTLPNTDVCVPRTVTLTDIEIEEASQDMSIAREYEKILEYKERLDRQSKNMGNLFDNNGIYTIDTFSSSDET